MLIVPKEQHTVDKNANVRIEYNPLYKEDPDIPKHIEQRTIGGLGIFMAKKMVDSIDYVREDDKNTLTLNKKMILS